MTDDRRRDAAPPAAGPITPEAITPGQRVPKAFLDHATDSTLDMPAVTPELLAAGSRETRDTGAADRSRPVDPFAGTTLGMSPPAAAGGASVAAGGGTLDMPAGDRVAAGRTLELPASDRVAAGGTLDLPASDRVAVAGAFDPGQVIGHFVIRARLGEGGMGMVLAAHDADLGRPVALKVVKSSLEHPGYRARLLREAQVMARLEHPNVVRVYEVGSDRGHLFIAMELVDGVTLTTWLRVQRRPWREIVAMFAQVGAGLAAVHRAGLVHRDFKPDNVLVDRDGRARVADFGLARVDPDAAAADPNFAASLTRTGMLLGTPGYMAPEQHFGGSVDARADQYSFCVALREALVGGRPTKLEDKHWGAVPRGVRTVIARGAAVDAAERFASMDALLLALARASHRRVAMLGAIVASVAVAGSIAAAMIVTSGGNARSARPQPAAAAAAPTPDTRTVSVPAAPDTPAGSVPAAPDTLAGSVPAAPDTPAGSVPAGPDTPAGSVPAAPEPRTGSAPAIPGVRASTVLAGRVPVASETRAGTLPAASDTRAGSVSVASGTRTGGVPAVPDTGSGRMPATPDGSARSTTVSSVAAGAGSAAIGGKQRAAAASTARAGDDATVVTPMETPAISKAAVARNAKPADTRHELIAAHRGAVREAVRDLGYGGIQITGSDRDADLRELETQLAAATDDLERGAFLYAMGQNERLRENCIGAARYWRDARKRLLGITPAPMSVEEQKRRNQISRFYGRVLVAEAMCELTNGRALGMDDKLLDGIRNLFGVADTERAQVWFAMAIAQLETRPGSEASAKQLLLQAARHGDASLRQAIDAYVAAVGLRLP